METKPLSLEDALSLDILRLQALRKQQEAQLVALQAQLEVTRILKEYETRVQTLARREDVEGWTLDLANRVWIAPTEEQEENGYAQHRHQ